MTERPAPDTPDQALARMVVLAARSGNEPFPEARDRLAEVAGPVEAAVFRSLWFPQPRRGQPRKSISGERRRPWNLGIAPAARVRVEAEAARRGLSPSALVEEWGLTLPTD